MRWSLIVCAALAGVSSAKAQSSAPYLSGVEDRNAYEAWYASLQGDYKTGVEFWVAHRSLPKEASCFNSGMLPASEWMHGCLSAQQRFTPLDARRKGDPEYRLGWNSVQSIEVQQAVAARQSTVIASVPTTSQANVPDGFQACRATASALQRLDCYDHIPLGNASISQAPSYPATKPTLPLPQTYAPPPRPQTSEAAFLSIVDAATSDFDAAQNDMLKGAVRSKRAGGLCLVVPNRQAEGWRGTISVLSSNGDGNGVLAIELNNHTTVKTWSNSFSDISDHTLIDPSSPVFQAAASLTVGTPVLFSGTFLPSQIDCVREASVSLAGSLQNPDFIMRFTNIQKAN